MSEKNLTPEELASVQATVDRLRLLSPFQMIQELPVQDPIELAASDLHNALNDFLREGQGTTDANRIALVRRMLGTLVTEALSVQDSLGLWADSVAQLDKS